MTTLFFKDKDLRPKQTETERETDRERDRQTERERETDRDRERLRQREYICTENRRKQWNG